MLGTGTPAARDRQRLVVIGYDQSEQFDVEPAEYFVLVTKREKRACRRCEEGGVTAAPVPARIIDQGLVSDRVVIDTVVSKVWRPPSAISPKRHSGAGNRA